MKKLLCLLLCVSILSAGCAGREANPIPAYLPGDNTRSCPALTAEVAQLQSDMNRLLPKTNKGVTNALWATAGVFLIVPFFFMDLKDAEKIEFEAMRQRHNRLLIIAADKNCDMSGVVAERIPSMEERKKAAKDKSKEQEVAQSDTANVAGQVVACANCGEKIGTLEKKYTFETHTVCAKCNEKLSISTGQ
jgi:RNA polymerase-binding transcription factor DksA